MLLDDPKEIYVYVVTESRIFKSSPYTKYVSRAIALLTSLQEAKELVKTRQEFDSYTVDYDITPIHINIDDIIYEVNTSKCGDCSPGIYY